MDYLKAVATITLLIIFSFSNGQSTSGNYHCTRYERKDGNGGISCDPETDQSSGACPNDQDAGHLQKLVNSLKNESSILHRMLLEQSLTLNTVQRNMLMMMQKNEKLELRLKHLENITGSGSQNENAGMCQRLEPGTVGMCVQECDNDASCPGIQKCCSNGCGRTCMDPMESSQEGGQTEPAGPSGNSGGPSGGPGGPSGSSGGPSGSPGGPSGSSGGPSGPISNPEGPTGPTSSPEGHGGPTATTGSPGGPPTYLIETGGDQEGHSGGPSAPTGSPGHGGAPTSKPEEPEAGRTEPGSNQGPVGPGTP